MLNLVVENNVVLTHKDLEFIVFNIEEYTNNIFAIEEWRINDVLKELVNEGSYLNVASLATSYEKDTIADYYLCNEYFKVFGIHENDKKVIEKINAYLEKNNVNIKIEMA